MTGGELPAWPPIRLWPAEAITAFTFSAAQSDSDELVRHLDWEPVRFNELFDRDKNVPPAGVAAEPEPPALLRRIFESAEAPRITIIVSHGRNVEQKRNIVEDLERHRAQAQRQEDETTCAPKRGSRFANPSARGRREPLSTYSGAKGSQRAILAESST